MPSLAFFFSLAIHVARVEISARGGARRRHCRGVRTSRITSPCAPPTTRPCAACRAQADPVARGASDGDSVRPQRAAEDVFAGADGETVGDSSWSMANGGIVSDMRAHLQRRRQREGADLISAARGGAIGSAVAAVGRLLRSRYLRNVRRSMLLALSMWSWYVFNTKTYVRPEYED